MSTLTTGPLPSLDPKSQPPTSVLRGHCLCKSIHVTIRDSELYTKRRGHICHCANCRKTSGSFAAANFMIETEKVEIEDREGTLTEYVDRETVSGKPLGRWFCKRCGNPVQSISPNTPGKVILKMGMFPRIPAPEFETFGDHRHGWQGFHPGVTIYKFRVGGDKLEGAPGE